MPARALRELTLALWLLLLASVVVWPLGASGVGWSTAAFALLPLIAPLGGLARATTRTLRWAPLTLAPALALAVTEILVNPPARLRVAITLGLILAAFAAVIAALRSAARG